MQHQGGAGQQEAAQNAALDAALAMEKQKAEALVDVQIQQEQAKQGQLVNAAVQGAAQTQAAQQQAAQQQVEPARQPGIYCIVDGNDVFLAPCYMFGEDMIPGYMIPLVPPIFPRPS